MEEKIITVRLMPQNQKALLELQCLLKEPNASQAVRSAIRIALEALKKA